MSTLVPALCWVPKGVSKQNPDKVELSPEEVQKLLKDAHEQLKTLELNGDEHKENGVSSEMDGEGGVVKLNGTSNGSAEGRSEGEESGEDNIEELYDMEHYDSEDDGEGEKISGAGMGNNLAGLTYYPSNDNDPYITLKNVPAEDEEEEDYRVLPTDNLLVIGRAEEDFSSVEIHVYNDEDDHSYSHHEILLTAFPLALEWLDFDPEQPDQKGNYLAIGTMTPVIEVWDLDTIDVLEPVFSLGDPGVIASIESITKKTEKTKTKGKKKKCGKSKTGPAVVEGHTDAILGISWNKLIRNILASASADCTVRVWDMAWPKSVLTLRHPDKVQCCLWHPYQPEILATGSYDGVVRLFNCKSSESAERSWKLGSEVERILWNHFKPDHLLACSEEHTVWCFNKQDGSKVFQIHAHDSAITDMSLSCHMPGLLVTAGSDDTIKFWDIHDGKPAFLMSRDMHMDAVMCARFCVDSPYCLAVGGQKNGFHVIDVEKLSAVMERFKKRSLLQPIMAPAVTTSSPEATQVIPEGAQASPEAAQVKKKAKKKAKKAKEKQAKLEKEEEMEVDETMCTQEEGSAQEEGSIQEDDTVATTTMRTISPTNQSKISNRRKKKSSKSKKKFHH